MCRLCDLYGDGGIWYMNPANYSRQLYRLRRPGEQPKGPEENPEVITEAKVHEALEAKMDHPERWEGLLREADEHPIGGGQENSTFGRSSGQHALHMPKDA